MTKYDPILLLVFLSGVVKLHFYVKWLSPFGSSPFLKCIWRITRSAAVASFHGWVLIRTRLLMSGTVYSFSLEAVTWSLPKSKRFAYPPSAPLLLELALGSPLTSLNCCIPTRFLFHLWIVQVQTFVYAEQFCSFVSYFSGFFVPFPRCLISFFFFALFCPMQLASLAMCCSSCVLLDERVNFSLILVFCDSVSFLFKTLFSMTLHLL